MATKVRLSYKPEGGSKRDWTIDLENPAWDVAFVTEKETGWPWRVFADKLSDSSHIALRALIFALRKRDEQRLSIDSVTPSLEEIDIEMVEDPKPDAEADPDPEA
jgi:hypothetical protein